MCLKDEKERLQAAVANSDTVEKKNPSARKKRK